MNRKERKINRNQSFLALGLLGASLAVTSCKESQEVKKPNILFAISDDQSFPHAGAYGCSWVKTPAFDRVAENGILFTNCYTPNAKCAPSRSILITGRNSWQLEAAGNHVSIFPKKFKSVFEAFEESATYFTGYTGKGVEPVDSQGRLLTGKGYNSVAVKNPLGKQISKTDYAANFEQFIMEKPNDKPFLFWFGCFEPHRAYDYGIGIEKGNKQTDEIDKVPGFWPDNDVVRTDMLDYAFEIEYFDKHLGRMLAHLEEIGELNNTVVIITSDNGMPFPRCKGIQYEYSNHLPLAIMWPDGLKNPGRVVTDYVNFTDMAPTFLDLAGFENAESVGMQPVQGESLLSIMKSEKSGRVNPERDFVLLGQERHDVGRPNDVGYPVRSVLREGILYIHNFEPGRWPMCNPETGYLNTDGSPTKTAILEMRRNGESTHYWDLCFAKNDSEELYNVKEDPECLNNLINLPEYASTILELRELLFSELKAQNDPRMFGNGAIFDSYPYAQESHRNFYERYMNGEITEFITKWVNPGDFEKAPLD